MWYKKESKKEFKKVPSKKKRSAKKSGKNIYSWELQKGYPNKIPKKKVRNKTEET